jgi:hypothetical protein
MSYREKGNRPTSRLSEAREEDEEREDEMVA